MILASVFHGSKTLETLQSTAQKIIEQASSAQTLSIPINALFQVLNHRSSAVSMETLQACYVELDSYNAVPYNRLVMHPFVLDLIKDAAQVVYKQKVRFQHSPLLSVVPLLEKKNFFFISATSLISQT